MAGRDTSRLPESRAEGQTPPVDRHSPSDGQGLSLSSAERKEDAGTTTDPQPRENRHRPEPPPQSSKPSLAHTRQHHLEESSGNAADFLKSNRTEN